MAGFIPAWWATGRAQGPPLRYSIPDIASHACRCSGGVYPRLAGLPGGHRARPYGIPFHASATMPVLVVAGFIPAWWATGRAQGPPLRYSIPDIASHACRCSGGVYPRLVGLLISIIICILLSWYIETRHSGEGPEGGADALHCERSIQ